MLALLAGDVAISGSYDETVDFGDWRLPRLGDSDDFVAKIRAPEAAR